MTGHFITYCSQCNEIISQCRCMDCSKDVRFEVCDRCKEKNEEKKEEVQSGSH